MFNQEAFFRKARPCVTRGGPGAAGALPAGAATSGAGEPRAAPAEHAAAAGPPAARQEDQGTACRGGGVGTWS